MHGIGSMVAFAVSVWVSTVILLHAAIPEAVFIAPLHTVTLAPPVSVATVIPMPAMILFHLSAWSGSAPAAVPVITPQTAPGSGPASLLPIAHWASTRSACWARSPSTARITRHSTRQRWTRWTRNVRWQSWKFWKWLGLFFLRLLSRLGCFWWATCTFCILRGISIIAVV